MGMFSQVEGMNPVSCCRSCRVVSLCGSWKDVLETTNYWRRVMGNGVLVI